MSERRATPEGAGQGDDLEIFGAPPAPPGDPQADDPPAEPASVDEVAHPALRALAFALDGLGAVAVTIVVVMGAFVAEQPWFFVGVLVVPLLSAAFATLLTALRGVTPGKALVGIRVVDAVTGRPPGIWAVPRGLVIVAPLFVTYAVMVLADALRQYDATVLLPFWLPVTLWIALLVVLVLRPRHRGLQDLAGRSIVVRRARLPR